MLLNKLKTLACPADRKNSKRKTKVLLFGICVLTLFLILNYGVFHNLSAQEQPTYDAKGKRNPFIPLVTPEGRLLKLDRDESKGDLAIDGIIYDKNGRSYAIVGGEVVGIGDLVNGYQVLKIEENRVILIKDGEATEVELKTED